MDATGRHAALISRQGEAKQPTSDADMQPSTRTFSWTPRLLEPVREFPEYTVVMQTLWPNLIVQQQSNTLAMRQLVTRGPASSSSMDVLRLRDDDEAMRLRRLRQANLMGPSGFVSIDDSEVMKFSQEGISP